jgi:PAS domain S-box-containing protein
MLTLDTQGRIASWNPGAERIFGYEENEIVGQDGRLLFTPEDRTAGISEQEMSRAKLDRGARQALPRRRRRSHPHRGYGGRHHRA